VSELAFEEFIFLLTGHLDLTVSPSLEAVIALVMQFDVFSRRLYDRHCPPVGLAAVAYLTDYADLVPCEDLKADFLPPDDKNLDNVHEQVNCDSCHLCVEQPSDTEVSHRHQEEGKRQLDYDQDDSTRNQLALV